MFLRSTNRKKDGKDHRYFSLVEKRRLPGGKTAQRTVLYLGRDQRSAAGGVEEDARGVRRGGAALHHDESVSGRSRASGRCGGQRTGSAERSGIEAATRVRQLLVSLRVVAATGSG